MHSAHLILHKCCCFGYACCFAEHKTPRIKIKFVNYKSLLYSFWLNILKHRSIQVLEKSQPYPIMKYFVDFLQSNVKCRHLVSCYEPADTSQRSQHQLPVSLVFTQPCSQENLGNKFHWACVVIWREVEKFMLKF